MKTKTTLQVMLVGALLVGAGGAYGVTNVQAETGGMVWALFKPTVGPTTYCEQPNNRCVTYSAYSVAWGGGNDPSWANARFQTGTLVGCTADGGGSPTTWKTGTASNPNAADFNWNCPFGQAGWSTWYFIDPL